MSLARFYASLEAPEYWDNGAVVFHSGTHTATFAKVRNCPILVNGVYSGTRLTCYATGHADTFFSIPAATRYKGQYIRGYFSQNEDGPVFHVMTVHAPRMQGATA